MSSSDDDVHHDSPGHESSSIRLAVAKKCSKAIINEVENELDPEKTEVLDFACGNGMFKKFNCINENT